MRSNRLAIVSAAIAVCGFVSACSYHKTTENTSPAPVVSSEPPPAQVVVQPAPAPAPMTSSSSTTTTTDNGGLVERQKTTTYTPAY